MTLLDITPSAVAGFFQNQARNVRQARREARLNRELSRLPRYIREDIGVAARREGYVNFLD